MRAVEIGRILLAAVKLLVPVTVLVVLGFAAYLGVRAHGIQTMIESEQAAHVSAARKSLHALIRATMGDLLILARSPTVAVALTGDDPSRYPAARDLFVLFAGERGLYDQLRLLGASGRELVRIDYRGLAPRVRPAEQLQDKSDRDYFQIAARLEPGEIYVSRLDLNIEHGQVERPLKPVLRLATPVHDEAGVLRGVMVLNVLGEALFGPLREELARTFGQPMLVANDGEVLLGVAPEQEWGRALGTSVGFADLYPQAARTLNYYRDGLIRSAEGLFTHRCLSLLQVARGAGLEQGLVLPAMRAGSADLDYTLTLVGFVSRDELDAAVALRPVHRVLFVTLLLAGMLLSLLVAWIRARQMHAERSRLADLQLRDHIRDPVLAYDSDGLIQTLNQSFTDLFGYLRDDLLGRPGACLRRDADAEGGLQAQFRQAEALGKVESDVWLRKKNGVPVLMRSTVCPIGGAGRRAEGFLEVLCPAAGERGRSDQHGGLPIDTDPLTGALSRHLFRERLAFCLALSRRRGERLALLRVRIEGFEQLYAGDDPRSADLTLEAAAAQLRELLQAGDTLARTGDYEFTLILMPGQAAAELSAQSAAAQRSIERLFPLADAGRSHVHVSVAGVQCPEDGESLTMLLEQLDARLALDQRKRRPVDG